MKMNNNFMHLIAAAALFFPSCYEPDHWIAYLFEVEALHCKQIPALKDEIRDGEYILKIDSEMKCSGTMVYNLFREKKNEKVLESNAFFSIERIDSDRCKLNLLGAIHGNTLNEENRTRKYQTLEGYARQMSAMILKTEGLKIEGFKSTKIDKEKAKELFERCKRT